MSSPSPHRLRTKTSDITDFFRNGSRSRAPDADEPVPSTPTFLSEPESLVRKPSSRIPFLGRQRKKSTQSDASTSTSSAGPSVRASDASAVRRSDASRLTEPLPDLPTFTLSDDASEPPSSALPTPSAKSSSSSLGSKIAARFVPSRQKFFNLSPQKSSRPSNDPPSNTLSPLPPSLSRAASVDSNSSENRSVTPRPMQPTITVSLPPDNLQGYEDMFTLPNAGSPGDDPLRTPTLQSASSTQVRFPTPEPSGSSSRQVDADTITMKRRGSRSAAVERSSSRSSRAPRKPVGTAFTKPVDIDSTDAEDSEAVMSDAPRPSAPMYAGLTPRAEKRRTLATMPYTSEKSVPKSIMKDQPHRPPTFPPPPTNPPSSALPVIPSSLSRKSNEPPSSPLFSHRQRAQTLTGGSNPPAPLGLSLMATIPTRRVTKSIGEGSSPAALFARKVTEEAPPFDKENFDMDKASAEQLRQALTMRNQELEELHQTLKVRNQQYDELASYLLKITDSHVAEKRVLVKKVAALEAEATRRENEIKGLTWLVTNQTRPGSSGSVERLSNAASKSTSALELDKERKTDRPPSRSKIPPPSNTAEDSGAESHQTASGAESYRESGPESYWGSGTSGAESSSSSAGRKVKRNHSLVSGLHRARTQTDPPSPLLPYGSSPNTKRSSISSFGSSPSSSTSSLSLPTLTPATTVTSLNTIPETPPPPPPSTLPKDPVVAAAILASEDQRAKEERRASRASNRVSASSVSSSASAAYAANLKRSRPPSIAQVLASSPKMENGRDKLRTYTSGSTST